MAAAGVAGVLAWLGTRDGRAVLMQAPSESRGGAAGPGAGAARLSADGTAAAISARLARLSPAAAASVLPWRCTCREDGCVVLRFEVAPHSDHFQTLMLSLFEMASPAREAAQAAQADGSAGVNGVVSAWDCDKTSTGLHVRLLHGDEEGAQVRISLPWADGEMASVELTSEAGGFTPAQATAAARIVYLANTSGAGLSLGIGPGARQAFGGGLLDLLPGIAGMQLPTRDWATQAGGGGEADGGHGSVEEQLVSMGAMVFAPEACQKECQHAGKRVASGASLPWDFLKGVDDIKEAVEEVLLLPQTHAAEFDAVLRGTRGGGGGGGGGGQRERPRAVLFEGPPGCGKTSMARMMAAQAQVPLVCVC